MLDVELERVVGVVFLHRSQLDFALFEIFVVVEVAGVGGDSVEAAHVLGADEFLAREEGFVELFAVAHADNFGFVVGVEKFLNRLREVGNGARGSFLNHDVAGVGVLERENHKFHRLFKAHYVARHCGFGDCKRLALFYLLYEKRNYRPARAHHVAVARSANKRVLCCARFRHEHFFHHRLRSSHCVDGIRGFVGGKADYLFDALVDGGRKNVVGAEDVGFDGLKREELARGHLFERGGVEDVVYPVHCVADALNVAHVADVEFDFVVVVGFAHIVLLFFVAGEYANLADIGVEKSFQYCVAE